MAPVTVPGRSGETVIKRDEQPFKAKLEKIPRLKPAFKKDGTVTAASSSIISDGAAALVLMRERTAAQLRPASRSRASSPTPSTRRRPSWFTTAPVGAIRKVCKKTGWGVEGRRPVGDQRGVRRGDDGGDDASQAAARDRQRARRRGARSATRSAPAARASSSRCSARCEARRSAVSRRCASAAARRRRWRSRCCVPHARRADRAVVAGRRCDGRRRRHPRQPSCLKRRSGWRVSRHEPCDADRVVLNATPGVDLIFTLARTLQHGVRGGISAALGISAGCVGHALAAASAWRRCSPHPRSRSAQSSGPAPRTCCGSARHGCAARCARRGGAGIRLRPQRARRVAHPQLAAVPPGFADQRAEPEGRAFLPRAAAAVHRRRCAAQDLAFLFLGAWFVLQGARS